MDGNYFSFDILSFDFEKNGQKKRRRFLLQEGRNYILKIFQTLPPGIELGYADYYTVVFKCGMFKYCINIPNNAFNTSTYYI